MTKQEPLLSVRGLCKHFPIFNKSFFKKQIGAVKASDEINFDLYEGETLGLVGESGCGKTTTGRSILRAIDPTRGSVLFRDGDKTVDLASLNPRMTVGDIVGEPLEIHNIGSKEEREKKVVDMLVKVGLKPDHRTRYPHAFSGGQRQRVGIARALIMNPKLVVCDEAVSALDVSVQAQVVNLLQKLQKELGLTYIFIAHDLSVVKHICDRIAVMYAGKIVELASSDDLFANPRHPYTRALLSAVPSADPDIPMNMSLSGEVADPGNLPEGCAFHPRCQFCEDKCKVVPPPLEKLQDDRCVACINHDRSSAPIDY